MGLISVLWGIVAMAWMVVALVPLIGITNWLLIPFAAIGAIVAAIGIVLTSPGKRGRAKAGLALNGIFSLSKAPLRAATWLGITISAFSFVMALWALYVRLTGGYTVPGWASIMVIMLFLGGVQLLTIGDIGEYLGRVYDEVKQRPLYVVARVSEAESSPGPAPYREVAVARH